MTTRQKDVLRVLAIGAGAVAVGYAVVKYPTVRASLWHLLKVGVGTTIPGIVLKQATDAWREAGEPAAIA